MPALFDKLVKQAKLIEFGSRETQPAVDFTLLPCLAIVVAEDNPDIREYLVNTINGFGHQVVAAVGSGLEMVKATIKHSPDVVVFDIHLPGIDGLTALREIEKTMAIAAVAVTGDRSGNLIKEAMSDNVLCYLLKPVDPNQLAAGIQLAWARFTQFMEILQRNRTLAENIENRKIIERAKEVLMRRYGWDEPTAWRKLQRDSMNTRKPIIELAHEILTQEGQTHAESRRTFESKQSRNVRE